VPARKPSLENMSVLFGPLSSLLCHCGAIKVSTNHTATIV